MKKTSINLLCVLIIAILSAAVVMPVYHMGLSLGVGFKAGMQDGAEKACEATPADGLSMADLRGIDVNFEPTADKIIMPNDSIIFDDGRIRTMIVKHTTVMVPEKEVPLWSKVLDGICYVGSIVFFILFMIVFIRFIIDINRGNIFVEKNVRRLRSMSIWLILMAIVEAVGGISEEVLLDSLGYTIKGYNLSAYWIIPWGNLLLGLLALLIAQVWDRGIKMEEEQRLTI